MFDPSAEVVLFLTGLSYRIYQTTTKLLIYWASCPRAELGMEVCGNLEQHQDAHIRVQKASTMNFLIKQVLFYPTMAIALPLLGVWGDKCGRKPPMLMSAVGELSATFICMMATIRYELTLILVYIGTFAGAVCGMGTSVSITGYIVDMTSEEDRRYRLAILYGAHFFGRFLGDIIAAVLLQYFRYPTIYCFSLAISAFTVVLIIVRIRSDTIIRKDIALVDINMPSSSRSKGYDTEQMCKKGKEWLRSIFGVLFKMRPNNGRWLIMILLATSLFWSTLHASMEDTMLLFIKRPTLKWSDALYGYYVLAKSGAAGLCLIILVPIMSKYVSVHDVTFLILGLIGNGTASLLPAVIDTSWVVFLSGIVRGLGVMGFTALQTMVTKVVSPQEVGCVLALTASLTAVCQLIFSPLIAVIYNSSVATFPGLTLVLVAGVYFLLGFIFLAISSWVKRQLPSAGHSSGKNEDTPLTLPSTPK